MENHADIISVGSIMFDIMSYIPRMPKGGESLPGCRMRTGFGGKGANPAVAIARLGGKVALVGKVGNDIYGKQHVENYTQEGIITKFIFESCECSSGTAVVIIDKTGENRILVDVGANNDLKTEEVKSAEKFISRAKVLMCNFEVNLDAVKESLILARKYNVTSILTAAPAISNPDPAFYELADIFCLNESEAEITTGMSQEDGYDAMAAELINRGCSSVVLTMGEKGVLYRSSYDRASQIIPALKVDPIDTTGAGDAFVGALGYFQAYFGHLTMAEKIRRAAHIASVSVQRTGTQTSYPYRHDLPAELFV